MIIRNCTTNQHCLGRDAIYRISVFHSVLLSCQSQIQFIADECGDAMNGDAMNRVSTCCNVQDRRVVLWRMFEVVIIEVPAKGSNVTVRDD